MLKKKWIEINGAILSCLFPQISSPLLYLPAIYKNSPGETEGLVRESMHDTIKFLSETEIYMNSELKPFDIIARRPSSDSKIACFLSLFL